MAFASAFCGRKFDLSKSSHSLQCRSLPPTHDSRHKTTTNMRAGTMKITAPTFDRRLFVQASGTALISLLVPSASSADSEYSTYKGPISLGYSFSYPSVWSVKKKPIRTHVSEVIVTNDKEPSTTAGLVVDAVKIDSIDIFGTPEAVGKRVVAVETKKDSVNSASVISAQSVIKDGLTYYILDYTVDSSRGVKRYIAKVTVTGRQLYVFTTQAKQDDFNGETEQTFAQMLDSFNVTKQYL